MYIFYFSFFLYFVTPFSNKDFYVLNETNTKNVCGLNTPTTTTPASKGNSKLCIYVCI